MLGWEEGLVIEFEVCAGIAGAIFLHKKDPFGAVTKYSSCHAVVPAACAPS